MGPFEGNQKMDSAARGRGWYCIAETLILRSSGKESRGEPLEPPPVSPARGPPTDWGELVQIHDDRDVFQASPDEASVIDIHSL